MKEIRARARELMAGYCRVCPRCEGNACAGEVPGMGGLGTGSSFKNNVAALDRIHFNMRLIHDVTDPDTRVNFLGETLALPLLAAPIGGVAFNMGGKVTEADYIKSKLEGCCDCGILGCTGDGAPAFIHETAFEAIKNLKGRGIPFIKPWEDQELYDKLEKVAATGARIVGMDVDAAGLITLKLMGRPVAPKSVAQLRTIIARSSMQFIIKGIMTPDDACRALDAGAAAIVVSNHGGRVLDHVPGVARVLPAVARAVKGQIPILADGGVRSGADMLKMLALGADLVMIGRPFSVAVMGGLKDGVVRYIQQLQSELVQAMILTGCPNVGAAGKQILL